MGVICQQSDDNLLGGEEVTKSMGNGLEESFKYFLGFPFVLEMDIEEAVYKEDSGYTYDGFPESKVYSKIFQGFPVRLDYAYALVEVEEYPNGEEDKTEEES